MTWPLLITNHPSKYKLKSNQKFTPTLYHIFHHLWICLRHLFRSKTIAKKNFFSIKRLLKFTRAQRFLSYHQIQKPCPCAVCDGYRGGGFLRSRFWRLREPSRRTVRRGGYALPRLYAVAPWAHFKAIFFSLQKWVTTNQLVDPW